MENAKIPHVRLRGRQIIKDKVCKPFNQIVGEISNGLEKLRLKLFHHDVRGPFFTDSFSRNVLQDRGIERIQD